MESRILKKRGKLENEAFPGSLSRVPQMVVEGNSALAEILEAPQKFYRDSTHLLKRCTKPGRKGISYWCVHFQNSSK
jgi:hypothetical protein